MKRKTVGLAAAGVVAVAALAFAGSRVRSGRRDARSIPEPRAESHMWDILSAAAQAEQVAG